MIQRVYLHFGENGKEKPLSFEPGTMTVFVGPNNSGKSLVLKELERYSRTGNSFVGSILDGLEVCVIKDSEFKSMLEKREVSPLSSETLEAGFKIFAGINPQNSNATRFKVNISQLLHNVSLGFRRLEASNKDSWREMTPDFFGQFLTLFTVSLNGLTRLNLTRKVTYNELLDSTENHLVALFQDPVARKRVRDMIHAQFSYFFVIDPTNPPKLSIRFSKRAPEDEAEEQALDSRARIFHKEAMPIEEFSDGVKAFTGIMCSLISSDFRIMLIDEPEAFLHPPLVQELGRQMGILASERKGNIFASTHSSRFLMGCIESGKTINVIRLTNSRSIPSARLLKEERLKELLQDPLLRSSQILEALFYSGAVVCEADSDRVFYSEINKRLEDSRRGYVPASIFLNGYGKHTIKRIIGPLREMGIPAAAIVDFDIIKKDDLKKLLACLSIPEALVKSIGQLRGQIEGYFNSKSLDMKVGGLLLLDNGEREACENLLSQLSAYGIFVVPCGEVERWLPGLGIATTKSDWLAKILDKMGKDPDSPSYVNPGKNDVWEFIEEVAAWIVNPNRKGMST